MSRRLCLALILTMATLSSVKSEADTPPAWDLADAIDGCALCRGGDCRRAVDNSTAGVFCGELSSSHEPCCCPFVTACIVDQFFDACQCKQPDQLEKMLFDWWSWAFLALVGIAFFPFALVFELVSRVVSVLGLHCQRDGGKVSERTELPASFAVREGGEQTDDGKDGNWVAVC